jgi:hypothetical protein
MFESKPNLHCDLKTRIVQGNFVIDKEQVLFEDKFLYATPIDQINNEKFKKCISYIKIIPIITKEQQKSIF